MTSDGELIPFSWVRVVDDNTIHAALHGAYQMVVHLMAINRLVEDQNIHLAGDGDVDSQESLPGEDRPR